jgi:hypothetical protein
MPDKPTNIERKHSATRLLLKLAAAAAIAALCAPVSAIERKHGVVTGTILTIDATARTIAVKTADGTEHTFLFVEHTTVHGTREAATGVEDAFHGLQKGGRVAVHYTAEGGRDTADEVDKIGGDGLKPVKVTIIHVDHAAKTVAVETEDGAKQTYRLTERATEEIGKDVAKGAEKTAKGTLYISEEAGEAVAHVFAARK